MHHPLDVLDAAKVRDDKLDKLFWRDSLGILYDQQGQYQQANHQYEQALKRNPKFGPAANNLAWNYAEYGGNIDVALALAQTAKEQLPSNPSISDTLGCIYYKKAVAQKSPCTCRLSRRPLLTQGIELRLGLSQ
jgi:tetratricopeptide (TPR) repeat protein